MNSINLRQGIDIRSGKFSRYWRTAILTFAFFSGPALANELLPNPGFEGATNTLSGCQAGGPNRSGNVVNGWIDNSCWTGAGTTIRYTQDTSNPRSGTHSQRVELFTGKVQTVAQTSLALQSGRTYSGKIWLRGVN